MRTRPLSHKAASLHVVPLFRSCDGPQLERIATLVDEVDRPAGTILIREGSLGGEAFVIVAGRIAVTRRSRRIATLGPGDVLGEMALLDPAPRSSTAVCQTATRLLVLDPSAFERLLEEPRIARRLLQTLARRLRADVDTDPAALSAHA